MPHSKAEDRLPSMTDSRSILSRRELLQRAAVLGLVSLPLVRGVGLAQITPTPPTAAGGQRLQVGPGRPCLPSPSPQT